LNDLYKILKLLTWTSSKIYSERTRRWAKMKQESLSCVKCKETQKAGKGIFRPRKMTQSGKPNFSSLESLQHKS
jgi:hypothetical protein